MPGARRSAGSRSKLDFRRGIPRRLLKEGTLLTGTVAGETVLLVCADGDLHAVGAHCSRDGAPLADGIVVAGEIRCPWHHGGFSLRTGDVTRPPALDPLPRWEVHEHNGRVFVGNRCRTRDPLVMRSVARCTLRTVVIIGGGAAGTAAAETLRSRGFKGTITMIDPDEDAPYDRARLSKDLLAGTVSPDRLRLRPPGFYAQHGIRRLVDAATSLDPEVCSVSLLSGARISYDALILATGAQALRPRIPGAELAHVHVLRSLCDYRALDRDLAAAHRVVIAGASFIGMETAAALRLRDKAVTVVAPEMIPFCHVLGPTIGASLMRLHERHGVRFALGRMLRSITRRTVQLDDGTMLRADVVLLGTGTTPRLAVAATAGVAIDNGVLVNEFLETNVARIYAAGDNTRVPDARSGQRISVRHWAMAQRQGEIAARNILGERVRFAAVPFFRTRQYDTTVSCVGHAEDFTHIQVDGSPDTHDCSASFMDNDRLLAYVSMGRDRQSLRREQLLEMEMCTIHENSGGRL
jgi:3-phenylpropionate/trans-cinnamate dioxygenase ferredoxin reductase subunit